MSKDPAFLFYYQDFLVGTNLMTAEEVGLYIRILCYLADKGKLSNNDMQNICKGYNVTDVLKSKFSIDENGLFYNKRLKLEIEKRHLYSESRRNNRLKQEHMSNICQTYVKHMENENINTNTNLNIKKEKEGIVKGGKSFDFETIWYLYPKKLGKKEAERHFNASVNNEQDYRDIVIAIQNYKKYIKNNKIEEQFIKHGSTFFNNWKDWINYKGIEKEVNKYDKYE